MAWFVSQNGIAYFAPEPNLYKDKNGKIQRDRKISSRPSQNYQWEKETEEWVLVPPPPRYDIAKWKLACMENFLSHVRQLQSVSPEGAQKLGVIFPSITSSLDGAGNYNFLSLIAAFDTWNTYVVPAIATGEVELLPEQVNWTEDKPEPESDEKILQGYPYNLAFKKYLCGKVSMALDGKIVYDL